MSQTRDWTRRERVRAILEEMTVTQAYAWRSAWKNGDFVEARAEVADKLRGLPRESQGMVLAMLSRDICAKYGLAAEVGEYTRSFIVADAILATVTPEEIGRWKSAHDTGDWTYVYDVIGPYMDEDAGIAPYVVRRLRAMMNVGGKGRYTVPVDFRAMPPGLLPEKATGEAVGEVTKEEAREPVVFLPARD